MKARSSFLRSAGTGLTAIAAAVLLITLATPASAGTVTDEYPETPALNPKLPNVKTTHKSDHIKANILNPHPVCNASEDHRTTVYKVTDRFLPVGTISTTNNTNKSIPLTQNTSKSQSISLEVNGSQTSTTSVNGNGSGSKDGLSGTFGIAWSLAKTIGGSASYTFSWDVGQTIGPYDVPAGHTGDGTYGFRAINMTGTQQFCKADGTWSNPTAWRAFSPIKNEVRVKIYDDPADSDQSGKPGADQGAPEVTEKENPKPTENTIDSNSEPTGGTAGTKPTEPVKHDLAPKITVSDAKAPGYAGLAALRVENVGTDRYFSEDPSVSFRVDVKTEKGPEDVDRLITPGWFNGAYTRDLGFDEKKSTRSFLVTLSNPIKKGETQLVANLDFGDGNTSEGRLQNSIVVSQVKRLDDDTSTYNDQNVSSKDIAVNDAGKPAKAGGLF
ncbi:hypothetical protein SAMN04489752_2420 [Brevibacterium siliguriense]|uniref:Secreted protein n=2 Tax=Brevibacterium siliguriense TaxID=1136497 RepID=A0A1H1URK6_9MICO|nr:hypothetical protein SAMN04489752_2420 [Brevibacterium siliguriense]